MNPTGVQAVPSEEYPVGEKMDRDAELQQSRRYQPVEFERAADSERTYTFPFSSEYPVQRAFGVEVLSHDRGAADLSRLNDGAPLLWNHDPGKVVGVVERAWIDEKSKRGYATVRFSRNAFAQEVLADVQDGVLRNVSFGYAINKMEERGDNFVATKWSAVECSLVSIPADPTVGVGRSLEPDPAASAASPTPQPEPEVPMDNTPDLSVVRAEAAEAERARISGITALIEKHGMADLGRELISGGRSLDEARAVVLERMGAKQEPIENGTGSVDMTTKEQRDYSVVRAINAAITGNWKEAGLEREVSQEIERQTGRSTSGFFMPHNIEVRAPYAVGRSEEHTSEL